MDTNNYIERFQKIADSLDKATFTRLGLEIKVGVRFNSQVLKIQKPAWLNRSETSQPFRESIFFSVWVNNNAVHESKLYYNIHALKLRELNAYKIKSRDFADAFRSRFIAFEHKWPNVSTAYGPLTLMEGWVEVNEDNFDDVVAGLAYGFSEIAFIIDGLLAERKKTG